MPKPKHRIFYLHGDFDDDLSKEFTTFYHECKNDKVTHATIEINSYGGYVHSMSSMASIIEQGDIQWIGVVRGVAMSCGVLLLAACQHRFASKRSRLMFHDAWMTCQGDTKEISEKLIDHKETIAPQMRMFAKRTAKTLKWWMEQSQKRSDSCYYFSARKAKELGVVDYIGTPTISVIESHELTLTINKDA